VNRLQDSLATPSHCDSIPQPITSESARPCLACGYDLQGLGDEPRCPECGLLNIPEGYRRQVHELVDSGKWFFSSFFGVFRKRPPGWWWSLDRPGDVKRASRFAVVCFIVSFSIIMLAGALAGSVVQTRSESSVFPAVASSTDPTQFIVEVFEYESTFRLSNAPIESRSSYKRLIVPKSQIPRAMASVNQTFQFTFSFLLPCLVWFGLILTAWAFPACVGFWTQIRNSLPPFARAPRTILAASLYECHRLVYSSIFAAVLLAMDAVLRWNGYAPNRAFVMGAWLMMPFVVLAFAAPGWIGPLRSDHTRQLVRSRKHALRILIMYALLFPALTVFAVVVLIASLAMFA
jgi:hypothetical protein